MDARVQQPDGRPLLASASYDRLARLWDLTTGTPVLKLLRRTPRRQSPHRTVSWPSPTTRA
jgi:WD40 repeat protein